MINLDSYFNETIDLQLQGKLVKVRELNAKQVQEFVDLDILDPSDRIQGQLELVCKALNRNTSAVTFTLSEVQDYPYMAVTKIMELLVNPNRGLDNDPN